MTTNDARSRKEPLTPAIARGARSFYADYAVAGPQPRVCRGLSCALAPPAETNGAGDRAQPAYCLGYCDQSPVRLEADGRPRVGADGCAPVVPDLRCEARRPVVLERLLDGDHADLDVARAAGVYGALADWVTRPPAELVDVVVASGERGRGGAGFATGEKWRLCAAAPGARKVVVANGDEGDPGSFVDRVLLEQDPHAVLEGLALCAVAVGAGRGIVYVRSEYPRARARITQAVAEARRAGVLGSSVLGSEFAFDVDVVSGHGSYVCGEETALLNSIEGRRGEVRMRPPYPVESGLDGRPTVVNNVETLVNIPWIAREGADAYRALGTDDAQGTKAMCLNHGFARPGIVEIDFGTPLRTVIEQYGGGGADASIEAVALGGPMGSVVTRDQWDVRVDYLPMHAAGIQLGHGGLVAFPAGTDYQRLARHGLEFMVQESCGRCVPCRDGSARALELVGTLETEGHRERLAALLDLIGATSLCAFGRNIPRPVRQLLALAGRTR